MTSHVFSACLRRIFGSECARGSFCSFRVVLGIIVGYCCFRVCLGVILELFGDVLVLSSGWFDALLASLYGLFVLFIKCWFRVLLL